MIIERVTWDGVVCFEHVLERVIILKDQDIRAIVRSFNEAGEAVFLEEYPVPADKLPDALVNMQTVCGFLISDEGYFSGATVVGD